MSQSKIVHFKRGTPKYGRIVFVAVCVLGATVTALFGFPLLGRVIYSPGVIFVNAKLLSDATSVEREKKESFEITSEIYWNVRFPRALFAMVAGAGLALAGMVFQAVFRNPLATPFTLGVSSGASCGATFYFLLHWHFVFLGLGGDTWFAFGGALVAVLIVHLLSWVRETTSEEMLLAGVAVSLFFSSLILLMQYVAEQYQVFVMIRWIMGGLENSSAKHILFLGPVVFVSMILLFLFSRELNIIVTGHERALAMGVNVMRVRLVAFYLVSLLVGGIVSVCGPIGFVGLIVPHVCRLFVGSDHRRLAPASALFGGLFLVACDTLARSIMPPIPVGVITNLLGGPFFLWILLSRNRYGTLKSRG
ncbi:MAG: iron ABC transporter permease [Planctomycetaceae bacterium]|nr:iron ABC transporter permease [Planctomycetaceae bacterium]